MSIPHPQKSSDLSSSKFRKFAAFITIIISILWLLGVLAAGIIAVPPPSVLSLYGGPAIACLVLGLALPKNRSGLYLLALGILFLAGIGWVALP